MIEDTGQGPLHLDPAGTVAASLPFRPTALITWADARTVLVADEDAGQIVFLPLDGSPPRRVGRKGSGPTDFRSPTTAAVSADGHIVVADGPLMRASLLRPDGTFLRTVPIGGIPVHVLSVRGTEARVSWLQMGSTPVVGTVDLEDGTVRERIDLFAAAPSVRVATYAGGGPSPFLAVAEAPDGTLHAGTGAGYRIATLREGRLVRSLTRDLPPEPVPDEQLDEMERNLRRAMPVDSDEMRAEMDRLVREIRATPRGAFRMFGLACDSEGRLWVITERGDGRRTELDVFGADGAFQGTLTVAGRVRSLAFRGDTVAVLTRRQGGAHDGEEGVDLYRLRSTAPPPVSASGTG